MQTLGVYKLKDLSWKLNITTTIFTFGYYHFPHLTSSFSEIGMAGRRGGTERVLTKLKASIENENYYEAHQMYRTLYFRLDALKS